MEFNNNYFDNIEVLDKCKCIQRHLRIWSNLKLLYISMYEILANKFNKARCRI